MQGAINAGKSFISVLERIQHGADARHILPAAPAAVEQGEMEDLFFAKDFANLP